MTEITVALVKELRERSGAGMMDCKKALVETGGDLEGAVDWLRKKGLSAAVKKSSRITAEGLVSVLSAGSRAVVVEVNSETDFVARNEKFQDFVKGVAQAALGVAGDAAALGAAAFPGGEGRSVEEQLTHMVATVGENMTLRRSAGLSVEKGVVATYLHNKIGPELGKIGVLAALESEADSAALEAAGRQIAMHIAAANPRYLAKEDVDPAVLEHERAVLLERARNSGRGGKVEAMVEGGLRKYCEEICLLEQLYVMDNKSKVSQIVERLSQELGKPVVLKGFVRFQLGEGIAKKDSDFAAEVAAAVKG